MTSHLLYDPDCGFCTSTAHRMERLGLGCVIEPMTPARLAELGIDAQRASREIPFVDGHGRVGHGARAIGLALATGNPLLRVVGTTIAHRPLRWLADPLYRQIATHRHQLPGGTAACAMPTASSDTH